MLRTQEFLINGGKLSDLENDLGIKITYHPNKNIPLIILNYSQIDSKPADHEIVVECRNLILELDTWNLVSRSFKRFFNMGQYPEKFEQFNFSDFFVQEKVDGSLMSLFQYRGSWHVTTRGSWANLPCGESNQTWSELFFSVLPLEKIKEKCNPNISYTFEFCGPWNKVVAKHNENKLFLLSAFLDTAEVDKNVVDTLAKMINVARPTLYNFKSIDEILSYIDTQISDNPTWEGVVICDAAQRRWKIKNPGYLALHRLANNGQGFSVKNLIPFILKGDEEEAVVYIRRYFKEVIPMFIELKERLDGELVQLMSLWEETKGIESQRDFAQAILPKTKFSSLLFRCRRDKLCPKDIWRESEDLILKVLFNK